MKSLGFTLIETVLYFSLFSLIFTGAIVTAYSIVDTAGKIHTTVLLQEESNFLIAKINWVLNGTQSIYEPGSNATSSLLSVNKIMNFDGNNQPIVSRVDLGIAANDIFLHYPDDTAPNSFTLNGSDISVDTLLFKSVDMSGPRIIPKILSTTFTLSARTPTGTLIRKNFSTTKYVGK